MPKPMGTMFADGASLKLTSADSYFDDYLAKYAKYVPGNFSFSSTFIDPEPKMPMIVAEWIIFASTWKVDGQLPITFTACEDKPSSGHLAQALIIATMPTTDVRTGMVTNIGCSKATGSLPTSVDESNGMPYGDNFLKALAIELYLHELNERIVISGIRKYDPHHTVSLQVTYEVKF